MKKSISILFFFVLLLMCSCEKKNYSVEVSDGIVNVKMHSPSMGIVGPGQVSYDGFTYEEVEKEVFDIIRSRGYNGSYSVRVTMQFVDSYGNYYDGESVTVSSLDATEVKKYASYYYFRDKTHIADAFPWNHQYKSTGNNNKSVPVSNQKTKCSYCINGKISKTRNTKNHTTCQTCNGTGNLGITECTHRCHQEAREPLYDSNGNRIPRMIHDNGDPCGGTGYVKIKCPSCNSKGVIESYTTEDYYDNCPYCKGTGFLN